jgi:hypothetical protein
VVHRHSTGLYIYGAGGIGKSHTVLEHLKKLEAPYRLFNSRMTAKGLFRAMEKGPDMIFVLDDVERLTNDRDAQGVLRSACWAQPGHPRRVTWTTAAGEEAFDFTGAIILLANRKMADLPELRALATRITTMELVVNDDEAVAFLRDFASKGYVRDGKTLIEPEQTREVVEHVISECTAAGHSVDLRLWEGSCQDYLMWARDRCVHEWRDLVTSRIRSVARSIRQISTDTPEEKRRQRRNIVRSILERTNDAKEQIRLYRVEAGAERTDFFDRKREVKSGEFDGEEAA